MFYFYFCETIITTNKRRKRWKDKYGAGARGNENAPTLLNTIKTLGVVVKQCLATNRGKVISIHQRKL